jgi:transposase
MTVSKSRRDGPPQRKRPTLHGQQRVLEPYAPSLRKRWEEGGHTATRLWRESREQGFAHSVRTVHRCVAHLRREGPPPTGRPRPPLTTAQGPSARAVAALILQRPARRTEAPRAYLNHRCAEDSTIATAVAVADDFLVRLRRRAGDRLPAWRTNAEASGIGEFARFAATRRHDLAAVPAGLTRRHSNGQTEGQVTRLKRITRQGYGRATVDLLRQRVLRAA